MNQSSQVEVVCYRVDSCLACRECRDCADGCGEARMAVLPGPIPNPSSVLPPPLMKGPDTVFEEIEKVKFICWDGITLRRTKLKAFHGKRSPG